jgi:hypothetical protein
MLCVVADTEEATHLLQEGLELAFEDELRQILAQMLKAPAHSDRAPEADLKARAGEATCGVGVQSKACAI